MSDPRLHGPETCPVAPKGCDGCSGNHHWLDTGYNPDDLNFEDEDETVLAVAAFDRAHHTEHLLAFYACKHCASWAECDYVEELEEADDFEDDIAF
jgi:hypothetical protein